MRLYFAMLVLTAFATGHAAASCVELDRPINMYPTAPELPSNLLRLYLYFPYPVRSPNILDHIEFKDARGRTVDGVFLSNHYDLWSPDRRRLTVLLNPGRVKTGLRAHETFGRALVPGEDYSLVIKEASLRTDDCEHVPDTVFQFSVIAADYDQPAPDEWRLTRPVAGSMNPLIVDLGSPHDHVSLAFRLRVTDDHGTIVPGRIELARGETIWKFMPNVPWPDTVHRLVIDELLEDLAGNRPGSVFDRPVGDNEMSWMKVLVWHPQ